MSNTGNANNSSSECVKVMVRCRPQSDREKTQGQRVCVNIDSEANCLTVNKPVESTHAAGTTATTMNHNANDSSKMYTYDKVFEIDSSQQSIYEESAFSLVESVSEGYNGTIFAYGQTGCGKTFTMMGDPDKEDMKGIIPRTFIHIMQLVESDPLKEFLVRCSYIEIYNEQIHDLLSSDPKARYELKESPDTGVFVKDLNKQVVKCVEDMNLFMNLGNKNRSIGSTAMNKESSRSHSIFTIFLEMSEEKEAGEAPRIRAGKLNLVDLAGSERQVKTQATGDRLKEANQINLSLSALGNVISALVDGKHTHIPYRDSKLTRLLQDSLGGNTKTVMIAAISPTEFNYDETMGTLRYASRAKSIKNKPKINEDPKDTLLREYVEEINRLKILLKAGTVQRPIMFETTLLSESEMEKWKEAHSALYKDRERMEAELNERRMQVAKEREQRIQLEMRIKDLQKDTLIGGKLGSIDYQAAQANAAGCVDGNGVSGNVSAASTTMEFHMNKRNSYDEVRRQLQKQEIDHSISCGQEGKSKQQQQQLQQQQQQQKQQLQLTDEEKTQQAKNNASLQEEANAQREEINILRAQIKESEEEIVGIENEHRQDKEVLLASIRIFQRENKIAAAILEMAFKTNELNFIKNKANWNELKNCYSLPQFRFEVKDSRVQRDYTQANYEDGNEYDQATHAPTNMDMSMNMNMNTHSTGVAAPYMHVQQQQQAERKHESAKKTQAHSAAIMQNVQSVSQQQTVSKLKTAATSQNLSAAQIMNSSTTPIPYEESPLIPVQNQRRTLAQLQQQQQELARVRAMAQKSVMKDTMSGTQAIYNNPANNISLNLRPSRASPYDFVSKNKEDLNRDKKRNLNGITLSPLSSNAPGTANSRSSSSGQHQSFYSSTQQPQQQQQQQTSQGMQLQQQPNYYATAFSTTINSNAVSTNYLKEGGRTNSNLSKSPLLHNSTGLSLTKKTFKSTALDFTNNTENIDPSSSSTSSKYSSQKKQYSQNYGE